MKRMVVFLLALVLGSAFAQNLYGLNRGMTRVQVHNILTKNSLLLTLIQGPYSPEDTEERWVYTKEGIEAYPTAIYGSSTTVTFDAQHLLRKVHRNIASNNLDVTYEQWYWYLVQSFGPPDVTEHGEIGVPWSVYPEFSIGEEETAQRVGWFRMDSTGEVRSLFTLGIDTMWNVVVVDQDFYYP